MEERNRRVMVLGSTHESHVQRELRGRRKAQTKCVIRSANQLCRKDEAIFERLSKPCLYYIQYTYVYMRMCLGTRVWF